MSVRSVQRRRWAGSAAVAAALAAAVPAPAGAATVVRVDAADSGGRIALRTGQVLEVVLPGDSASTGYHWTTSRRPDRAVLRLRSSRAAPAADCPEGAVGCPTRLVMRYDAVGRGTTALSLAYRPPGTGRVDRRFRLGVRVRRTLPAAPGARFAGRTSEGAALRFRTTAGGRRVVGLTTTMPAPSCGGVRAALALDPMRIGRDGGFAAAIECEGADGTQTYELQGRVEGSRAVGRIRRTFVGTGGDPALGGGTACTDVIRFTASVAR